MVSIAEKIGCDPLDVHEWVKKAEVADKVKALEREVREVRELRQANEILRKASAYLLRRSSTAR